MYTFRNEKKLLEEEMNRRSVRDMEARQQCFKGECEIRQLKKEMRRDKLQLKELEQQISVLKSKGNGQKSSFLTLPLSHIFGVSYLYSFLLT